MPTPAERPRIPVLASIAAVLVTVVAGCVDSSSRPSIVSSDTTFAGPTTVTAATVPIATGLTTPPSLDIGTTIPLTHDTADIPNTVTGASSDIPPATVTGASSDIPGEPPNSADLPADARTISVTVGVDASPTRVEPVAREEAISLEVTNPNADDEFVLEGYGLGKGTTMPKATTETITFVANQPGQFRLTSRATSAVLLVLDVS